MHDTLNSTSVAKYKWFEAYVTGQKTQPIRHLDHIDKYADYLAPFGWEKFVELGYDSNNQEQMKAFSLFTMMELENVLSTSFKHEIRPDLIVAVGASAIQLKNECVQHEGKYLKFALKAAKADRVAELIQEGLTPVQAIIGAVQGFWFIARAKQANTLNLPTAYWNLIEHDRADLEKVAAVLAQVTIHPDALLRLIKRNLSSEEIVKFYTNFDSCVWGTYTDTELRSITINPLRFNRIFSGAYSLGIIPKIEDVERSNNYGLIAKKHIRDHGHLLYAENHRKATFPEILESYITSKTS